MRYKILAFPLALLACSVNGMTQNPETVSTAETQSQVIMLDPLFEYPSAPEEIDGIEAKSEWLLENFWKPLDFKSKTAVDQIKLNHAFNVYLTPMRWAAKDKCLASVDELLKALHNNPTLLLQFVKAAEENLYGPRAEVYIDEIYVKFLDEIAKNKKIKPVRKARYQRQLDILSATMPGQIAPRFKFKKSNGEDAEYFPMSTFTIIEFGDPSCSDCRLARLKMESNAALSQAIAKGKVNVLFIIPDAADDWAQQVNNYSSAWVVGASDDVDDIYDLRLTPTFYTIGTDGKIISKNITVEEAIRQAVEIPDSL